jgi:hypothetical protein
VAVRCQEFQGSDNMQLLTSLVGGSIGILAAIYFGLGFSIICNAVSLWLLQLSTKLLLRFCDRPQDMGGLVWLMFVVIGGGGGLVCIGILTEDAGIGSLPSWLLLLGGGLAANAKWVRGGSWSWGWRRVAWYLTLMLLLGCGGYATVVEAVYCGGDSTEHDGLAPPPLGWVAKLRGQSCRCAGDYLGMLVSTGEGSKGEACFCFDQWPFASAACIRRCHEDGRDAPVLLAGGSCQCTPRADAAAQQLLRSASADPWCTAFANMTGTQGNPVGQDICHGKGTSLAVGEPRCQRAVLAGLVALAVWLVLVALTVDEVTRLLQLPATADSRGLTAALV